MILLLVLSIVQAKVPAKASDPPNRSVKEVTSFYTGPQSDSLKEKKVDRKKLKSKLDSKLLELTEKKESNSKTTKDSIKEELKYLKQPLPENSPASYAGQSTHDDLVYVYINTKTSEGIKSLEPYTYKVDNIDINNNLFTAWVEISKLQYLEQMNEVLSIQLVNAPKFKIDSEGDQFHRADLVRSLSNGTTGQGIKVGVISDGVDHLSESVSKGALNPGVTVLSNTVGGDEGTAMLEVVHALAPNASLYFHDSGNNIIAFNQAIDDLVAAGCKIIVDDVLWITEPFFEDGTVASHVKDVIDSKGIIYVSAAGNSGSSHYIGYYMNDGDNFNDFGFYGNDRRIKYMYMNIKPGETANLVLQWDDPFNNSTNDYDLYLLNTKDLSVLSCSSADQTGSGSKPLEVIQYTNTTSTDIDAEIDIYNYNGQAASKNLDLYIYGHNYADNVVSHNSIFGQAAVPGVITAAAVDVANPQWAASYSSQGPVSMLDGSSRQKPDISGATGVTVSGAGGFPTTFTGTSAAAPHIAAIAALLWAKDPTMTNTTIRNLILNNAVDYGTDGFDYFGGYGKADAYNSYLPLARLPKAIIKSDTTTYKGFKVQLDGSNSSVGRGPSLTYNWKIISKPSGSQAVLVNPTSASPYFFADALGEYKFSLSVNDTKDTSAEVYGSVKVKDITSTSDDIDLSSGTVSPNLNPYSFVISKPVVLTDGWFITADNTNKIKILNAFTGSSGKSYQLTAMPNSLDFDFDKKVIIASLTGTNQVVKIDTNTDIITYIDTPYSYGEIINAENDTAFAITSNNGGCISIIDTVKNTVLSSKYQSIYDSPRIVYDKNTNSLITAALSDTYVYKYFFDETSKLLTTIEARSLKRSINNLYISPDGKKLGIDGGYDNDVNAIFDVSCLDMNKQLGEWNIESPFGSAAFSGDSKYIAVACGDKIKVFDSEYHFLVKTINRNTYTDTGTIQYSRSGKFIFDYPGGSVNFYKCAMDERPSADPSYQPVVMTKGDLSAYKGFNVGLDGGEVLAGTNSSLTYKWSFASKPEGSSAVFTNSTSPTPYFKADAPGTYKVNLVVNDGTTDRVGATYNINIKEMDSVTDDITTPLSMPIKTTVGTTVKSNAVPLTDGWLITADDTNKILLFNANTGAVGKQYQVVSAPTSIDFDFEKKCIIASLSGTKTIAVIDTTADSINYIDTPYPIDKLMYAGNNIALVTTYSSGGYSLYAMELDESKALSPTQLIWLFNGPLAYDKINHKIYASDSLWGTGFYRYSFDVNTKLIVQEQKAPYVNNGQELTISPDGKHLALSRDSNVGISYIYDIDCSDLSNKLGQWDTGYYANSAGFSKDSKYVVTSNKSQLMLFDVQNHKLINTTALLDGFQNSTVMISRGGKYVFAFNKGDIASYESGIQQSILKGDFDSSGTVDILDLAYIAQYYNIKSTSVDLWKPELDLTQDKTIDIYDLVLVSKNMK